MIVSLLVEGLFFRLHCTGRLSPWCNILNYKTLKREGYCGIIFVGDMNTLRSTES